LLVDGESLSELALEHGVGVNVDYLPLYSITADFWQASSGEIEQPSRELGLGPRPIVI
jgi:hypothetical protein